MKNISSFKWLLNNIYKIFIIINEKILSDNIQKNIKSPR